MSWHGSHDDHDELHHSQENCTVGHIEKERFGCHCYPNYDGEFCETRLDYVHTFAIIGNVVGIVGMLVPIYWLSLRLYFLAKKKVLQWNLNSTSLILTLTGCVAHLIWCILPSNGFMLDFEIPSYQLLVFSLLETLAVCLWVCTNFLILGFWFDVIKAKLAKGIAVRTRIVCIAMAAISLLRIPGSVMQKFHGLDVLSSILLMVPLAVNLFGLIGVTFVISFYSTSSFSRQIAKKKKRMVRRLWVGNVSWGVYLIANVYLGAETLSGSAIHSLTIVRLVTQIAEVAIALSIASMIDQKTGILLLTRWVLGRIELDENSSRSTLQSSKSRSRTTGGQHETPTNTTTDHSVDSVSVAIHPSKTPELCLSSSFNSEEMLSYETEKTGSSKKKESVRAKVKTNSKKGQRSKKGEKEESKEKEVNEKETA